MVPRSYILLGNNGQICNRGFLNGAACPIYGLGAGFLIFCLIPVQDNLLLLYLGSVVIGSLLELVGGFLLKKLFHMTWWDYSDEPLNIGGYICLKFSLAWGLAGVMLMRVIHPLVIDIMLIIPDLPLIIMLSVFYITFAADLGVTVAAVLKLNRDLQEITRLSELIHRSSDKLAESIGNTALFAADKIKELEVSGKAREISERLQLAAEDNRGKVQAKLEDFEKLNALLNSGSFVRSRLLNAFPGLKNLRDSNALFEMKNRFEIRIKKSRNKNDKA